MNSYNVKNRLPLSIDSLQMAALDRWNNTTNTWSAPIMDDIVPKFTLAEQKQNERFMQEALASLKPLLRTLPNNDDDFAAWQEELTHHLKEMIQRAPFLNEAEKAFMSDDSLLTLSNQFIQQALEDVPNMDFEGLGQGLRNLWIACMLQSRFGYDIELTPSLYGYSMLYPLTDTLMDDTSLSQKDKNNFCKRLTDRLMHKAVSNIKAEEISIYKMLDLVDSQYPPQTYPEVHESLLAIQKGQERSLMQQQKSHLPYMTDLLGISFSKGGTSVLADAYLVSGTLDPSQAQFAYDFGAILQLCDDLQDIQSDSNAGHMTLFSQLYKRHKLDPLLLKMLNYLMSLTSQHQAIDQIIQRNCMLLIIGSSLSTPHIMGWRLNLEFSKRMPIRLKVLRKMNRELSKEFGHIRQQESTLKKLVPKPSGWNKKDHSRYSQHLESLSR